MKVMAIGAFNKVTAEQIPQHLAAEVPATLKLYLNGPVEQFWFQENAGPIFLMEVDTLDHARAALATLPLVAADLMTYQLLPIGPLAPLGMLIQGK